MNFFSWLFSPKQKPEIKVSRVTGIELEKPELHNQLNCTDCLSGDPNHIQREWDGGLTIHLRYLYK
jgi:hypothetical protein